MVNDKPLQNVYPFASDSQLIAIAEEHETPLYVHDENSYRRRLPRVRQLAIGKEKRAILQVLTLVFAAAFTLAGSGCVSSVMSGSGPMPTFSKPELLYLLPKPYSRLYVEVDTIENLDVPQEWLEELKTFLSQYLVHCLPGLVVEDTKRLAQKAVIHHGFYAQTYKASQEVAVFDANDQLSVAVMLDEHDK